jgi:hypothetical protein
VPDSQNCFATYHNKNNEYGSSLWQITNHVIVAHAAMKLSPNAIKKNASAACLIIRDHSIKIVSAKLSPLIIDP